MKYKKGSALLIVIAIMSILTVVGAAMISLAMSSYKLRYVKSYEKYNFYAAQSGIDRVNNIIQNTVNNAIKYGNDAVNDLMNRIDLNAEMQKEMYKNKLKSEGKGESEYGIYDSKYINDDLSLNQEYLKEQQNIEFKRKYKYYIQENIVKNIEDGDYKVESGDSSNKVNIAITNKSDNKLKFEPTNDKMHINIKSNYIQNKIEKELAVEYIIDTPEYGGSYYVEKKFQVHTFKSNIQKSSLCRKKYKYE